MSKRMMLSISLVLIAAGGKWSTFTQPPLPIGSTKVPAPATPALLETESKEAMVSPNINEQGNVRELTFDFQRVKSLAQIESVMSRLTPDQIQQVLESSQKKVAELQLIEKANAQRLTQPEAALLSFELRKQTVARKLNLDKLFEEKDGES